jgi:hypothetical protein
VILPKRFRHRQRGFVSCGPAFFGSSSDGDASFAQVVGLYHFDTDFSDSASKIGVLSAGGNASINAGAAVFGAAGARFVGSGASHAQSQGGITTTTYLGFGTGDWCIEFWFNSDISQGANIIDCRPPFTPNVWIPTIYVNTDGTIRLFMNGADKITSATSTVATSTDYFCHASRVSGVTKMFLGTSGTASQVGSDFTDANSYAAAGMLTVASAMNQSADFDGDVDEVRITNGNGRRASGDTTVPVPTAAFPNF